MSVKLSTLHHVGIVVSNMERSLAFYSKLIGNKPQLDVTAKGPELEIQTKINNATMHIVMIGFDNGSTGLELIEYKDKKGNALKPNINDSNTLHFCFEVDDAQEVYKSMVADGYEFMAAPQFLDEKYGAMKGHTFGYFHGPDGELLEIMQNPTLVERILG